ncbi:hypothetical protein SAMN05192584_104287 [Streptomyces pini]|uniref:Uncharacterized protein n=2 Tax=Streptomyces pini TaxID=1520580 RepID=A0A1I3XQI9_9ACTN|nr:hypothetical protein SAMN05192584_104287 [Streptomyces pini]
MNESGRTAGRVRGTGTGFLSAPLARHHGRRDAADLETVLAGARAGDAPPDPPLPPYVLGLRSRADRGNSRLRARMLAANRGLSARIQAESVRVVIQYAERGRPAPAALARYGEMVARWRSTAAVHRAMAQELVDRTNWLLACYWDSAWQRARRQAEEDVPADSAERRPTRWLPGRVRLDPTWHRVDDWLDTDCWYQQPESTPDAQRSALRQALAILDGQTAGAARTSTRQSSRG